MHHQIYTLITCLILTVASSQATAKSESAPETDDHRSYSQHNKIHDQSFDKKRLKRYFRGRHTRKDVPSIATAADRSGRLAGTAAAVSPFNAEEQYRSILNHEFNYVTPENSAKWGELQPQNANEWEFDKTDTLLDNSEANNQLFKGHALVWHVQLPNFINDELTSAELNALTTSHINTVLGRYLGRIYAWDVVNEAISDGSDFYRDTVFLRKLGADYIANAFHTAKMADPIAKLYYNDYGIERINTKSSKVYELVKNLTEQGVPIDGVGFQMHLDAAFPPSVEQIVENFERFTALGLTVNVSELDVRIANLPWDKPTNLAIQRQVFHRVVDACMQVANCEGISTWGFTDRHTWIDSTFAPDDPLLYNEDYEKKPAYYGMIDGFVGLDADQLGAMPNLIDNSSFESGTEQWSVTDDSKLKTISSRRVHSKLRLTGRRSLQSSKRTDSMTGPSYNLLGLLRPNQTYDVSSLVSIRGARKAHMNASVALQCVDDELVQLEVASIRAKRYRWRTIEGQFTTPDCELISASLSFFGPEPQIKLLVDNPSVRPQELVIAENDNLGPNVLSNSGFESGVDDWFGFDTATIEASEKAPFAGAYAAFASTRSASFDGIATSITAIVEPGSEYQLTSRIRTNGASVNSQTKATLRADCADGPQFISVAGATANDEQWALLTGKVTIPSCGATDLTLYFEGPDAEVDLFLDEVYLQKVLTPPTENLLTNSDFEENTDGWFAFGSAYLSTTELSAFQGEKSLLASDRTQTYEGPAISLTNIVTAGSRYRFAGQSRIQGGASAPVRATLQVSCDGENEEQYLGAASATATDSEWTPLEGGFTVPDCEITTVNLFIEGPDAGIDILIDALLLESSDGGAGQPNQNIITNSGFETGTAPWFGFGAAILQTSSDEFFSGTQSLHTSNRTANFEGPAIDLIGLVSPSQSVTISAQTKLSGISESNVSATIQTVCEDESEQYNGTGEALANDQSWTEITGGISLPACIATAHRLYFQGPDADIDIFLDDVEVTID